MNKPLSGLEMKEMYLKVDGHIDHLLDDKGIENFSLRLGCKGAIIEVMLAHCLSNLTKERIEEFLESVKNLAISIKDSKDKETKYE